MAHRCTFCASRCGSFARARADQPPDTKAGTSDEWRATSRQAESRVPFPVLGPLALRPKAVFGRRVECPRPSPASFIGGRVEEDEEILFVGSGPLGK